MTGPRYRLTIESTSKDDRTMPNLRRLLKAMIRGYGFRVVDIEPLVESNEPTRRPKP
ncbi:MAG: hypothetical protein AAGD07_10325 [Planctomycetota bacterium]